MLNINKLNLCGKVYITSDYSYVYSCLNCQESFNYIEEFQNHQSDNHLIDIIEDKKEIKSKESLYEHVDLQEKTGISVEEIDFDTCSKLTELEIEPHNDIIEKDKVMRLVSEDSNALEEELQTILSTEIDVISNLKHDLSNLEIETEHITTDNFNEIEIISQDIISLDIEKNFRECNIIEPESNYTNTESDMNFNLVFQEDQDKDLLLEKDIQEENEVLTEEVLDFDFDAEEYFKNTPVNITDKLQCQYCRKKFHQIGPLQRHIEDHYNLFLTCKYCGKHTPRRQYLVVHLRTHRKTRCKICDRLYTLDKEETHLKQHEFLTCQICRKFFKKKSALNEHYRVHTGEKPYKCDKCKAAFALKSNLKSHIRTQHTLLTKNITCEFCNKKFMLNSLVDAHIKRMHLNEKPFQCEFCGVNFASPSGLRRHKLKHHTDYDKRPHHCSFCNKKFVELSNLTEHLNTHTGAKPFTCGVCSKRFASYSGMKEHTKIHSDIKTHICKLCGKAFTQKPGFTVHMKKVHNITN